MKRGRRAVFALLLLVGCGYKPLASPGDEKLAVVLVASRTAHAAVDDEVVRGVRDELLRFGMLRSGSGYPRVEVEVLRTDERTVGVQHIAPGQVRARGVEGAVLARAWIVEHAGADPVRDTGDVRRDTTTLAAERGDTALLGREDQLRGVGRAVGRALGKRLAGDIATSGQP